MASAPAILRRLPSLWWRPPRPQHIVDPDARAAYPDLAADFAVLDDELMEHFRQADTAALGEQNTFYLTQFAFATGAVVATILGAIQAAVAGGEPYIGIAEAGLTAFLGAGALVAFSQGAQRAYYSKRLVAERLRSEYFLFLGHIAPYANPAHRLATLRQRVAEITT